MVSATDVEMLEDLIVVAVADAQTKAAALAQAEMGKLTGGLPLPFKLPFYKRHGGVCRGRAPDAGVPHDTRRRSRRVSDR